VGLEPTPPSQSQEQYQQQHNLFYHAWLHDDLAEDRVGAIKYPLIGLFPTTEGGEATLAHLIRTGDDVAFIGINELKWADQHVHKESYTVHGCKLEDWNMGTDQARFYLGQPNDVLVHSFYAVAVDLDLRRVNVSLVSIVAKPLEAELTKCAELPTMPDLHKFFEGLKEFGHVLDLLTQEKPWSACAACTTRSPEGEPACITCGRPRNGYKSEAEYLALKNDAEREMYLKLRAPPSGMAAPDAR